MVDFSSTLHPYRLMVFAGVCVRGIDVRACVSVRLWCVWDSVFSFGGTQCEWTFPLSRVFSFYSVYNHLLAYYCFILWSIFFLVFSCLSVIIKMALLEASHANNAGFFTFVLFNYSFVTKCLLVCSVCVVCPEALFCLRWNCAHFKHHHHHLISFSNAVLCWFFLLTSSCLNTEWEWSWFTTR